MHRLFERNQVLTIPNFLSLLRLLMIPLIVWLYCVQHNRCAAAVTVLLSGITDIADGMIARRFRMVSDFGKILDPLADKLTQGALMVCLLSVHGWMLWLLVLFIIKEMVMGITGLVVIRKKNMVNSAQWFGKVTTVVLYAVMILLFLFPNISETTANVMILICAAVVLISLVKYLLFYVSLLSDKESCVSL